MTALVEKPVLSLGDISEKEPPFIIFDLDDTVIDTYQYWLKVFDQIADKYPRSGINPQYEGSKERLRDFYRHQSNGVSIPKSVYDFQWHLGELGLSREEDNIRALLNEGLVDKRLYYSGVNELMEVAKEIGQVAIVTYGLKVDQEMKVASLPELLQGVPVHTTLQYKPDFIAEMRDDSPNTDILVVDDANIGQELARFEVAFVWATWSESAENRSKRSELEPWHMKAENPSQASIMLREWDSSR